MRLPVQHPRGIDGPRSHARSAPQPEQGLRPLPVQAARKLHRRTRPPCPRRCPEPLHPAPSRGGRRWPSAAPMAKERSRSARTAATRQPPTSIAPTEPGLRKFVYGKTREEVAGKLTELQEKTRQGVPAASSTMAFGDYLTYWLAAVAPERLKPATLNSYEGLSRLYIRPAALGKKRLNRLSPADVRRFLTEFKASCLCCLRGADKERPEGKRNCCAVGHCCKRRPSARTVQYIHAVLRSALQQAMREELIARNVARIVETPTVDPKEEYVRCSNRRSAPAAQDRPDSPPARVVAAAHLHRATPRRSARTHLVGCRPFRWSAPRPAERTAHPA